MSSKRWLWIVCCAVVSGLVQIPFAEAGPATQSGAGKPAADLNVGKAAYEQSCARCHGATGQGDGDYGKRLYPKPRDVTSGIYKFRSTASGTPPTDDDLFGLITHGLNAGGMPDWPHLNEATRWQIVYYLKTLSPVFQEQEPQVVDIGKDPGPKRVNLAKGKQLYEQLGCAACHGAAGRANGPSAAGLVDDWGRAIRPADLTQGWSNRGGADPRAITTRILTGISGAPMPSYSEAVSVEDSWQLAYYVQSLQREPTWLAMSRVANVARAPTSLDDAAWQSAQRIDLRLRQVANAQGEVTAPLTVSLVSFWVVADETTLAVRLQWHDPSEDRGDSADAIALVLRPEGLRGDVASLQYWPLRHSPSLDFCAWSAARPQTIETVTRRYEEVVSAQATGAVRTSEARYEDGRWTAMITRPRTPTAPSGGAQLIKEVIAPVAVVVWDGGNPGQRAVSSWHDLMFGEPPAHGGKR